MKVFLKRRCLVLLGLFFFQVSFSKNLTEGDTVSILANAQVAYTLSGLYPWAKIMEIKNKKTLDSFINWGLNQDYYLDLKDKSLSLLMTRNFYSGSKKVRFLVKEQDKTIFDGEYESDFSILGYLKWFFSIGKQEREQKDSFSYSIPSRVSKKPDKEEVINGLRESVYVLKGIAEIANDVVLIDHCENIFSLL